MSDSSRSARLEESARGLGSLGPPSMDVQSLHRQLEDTEKPRVGKRGRPGYELKQSLRRSLLRWYVTTSEPLSNIQTAVQAAGGPRKQWVRQWLEEITGVKDDPELSLDALRMNDSRAKQKRESEQQRAHSEDQRRRGPGAPRVLRAEPQFHGLICPSSGTYSPNDPQGSAISKPQDESRGLIRGTFNDSAHEPTLNTEPGDQGGSHSIAGPSIGHYGLVGPYSGLSGPVSPVFARLPDQLRSQTGQNTGPAKVRPKSQRRVSTISASSVVECLVSKKRSLCSFIAKRASISVFGVPSRASTAFSLSRLTRPSLYQQFYARQEASERDADGAATTRPTGDLVDRTDFACGNAAPQTAVELLISSRNHKLLDLDVQHLLLEKLSNMPGSDERHAYVRAADHRGVTALHLAVAYGYPLTCGLLLRNGADHQAKTCVSETPRDFARSAEKAAGRHECLKLYYRIMLCRDRVKYNLEPPAPQPRAGDYDVRPPKRRMTSQTARLGHQSRRMNTSSSSLRRSALSRMTNDETLRSFSAEDVSAWNTPRGSLDHNRDSFASSISLNPSAAQTQESLLAFGCPYTNSPQASTQQDHPLRAESTFEFATSPTSTIPTGHEAPPWPTNDAQGLMASRTNPNELQTVPYGQGITAQTQPSMYSQDINNGFSSQSTLAFDPVTSTAAFDDTTETLPTVLSANMDGSDHLGFGPDLEDWSQFSDGTPLNQYDFTGSQNAVQQMPQTFNEPTLQRLDQHSNFAGPSNSRRQSTFTAPTTQDTTQPSTFVPPYSAQRPDMPKFIPTPSGLDIDGSQPIWYNCPHNNPTSTRGTYCPMGCTVLDAILSQTSQG